MVSYLSSIAYVQKYKAIKSLTIMPFEEHSVTCQICGDTRSVVLPCYLGTVSTYWTWGNGQSSYVYELEHKTFKLYTPLCWLRLPWRWTLEVHSWRRELSLCFLNVIFIAIFPLFPFTKSQHSALSEFCLNYHQVNQTYKIF